MKTKNLVRKAKELLDHADAGKVTIKRGVDGVTVTIEAHTEKQTLQQLDGSHSVGERCEPLAQKPDTYPALNLTICTPLVH